MPRRLPLHTDVGLPIPFATPDVVEDDVAAVARVLRSGWWTSGEEVLRLEDELAQYLGAPHVIAVSSCTAALELSLRGVGALVVDRLPDEIADEVPEDLALPTVTVVERDDLRVLWEGVRVGRRVLALQQRLAERVVELQEMIANVKQLRGLLPICSYCKRIRSDSNYWEQVESYISNHTDAEFTHGICPCCYEKVLAELNLVAVSPRSR